MRVFSRKFSNTTPFVFPKANELEIQLKHESVFPKANELKNRLKHGRRTKIPEKYL